MTIILSNPSTASTGIFPAFQPNLVVYAWQE